MRLKKPTWLVSAVFPAVLAQSRKEVQVSNAITHGWKDIVSVFLREQTTDDMAGHGCWCTKLNPQHQLFPNTGGKAVDDLDLICKHWFQARRCLTLEDGPCNDKTVYGKAWKKDFYTSSMQYKKTAPKILEIFADCPQSDQCGRSICKIDAFYANQMFVFFQKAKRIDWYDSNVETGACRAPTAHLHPNAEQVCEGDYNDVESIKIKSTGMTRGLTNQANSQPDGSSQSISQPIEEPEPVVDERTVQQILDSKELKSEESTEEVTITFTNDSGNILSYYWIDYNGDYAPYYVLMPDQSYDQPSYASHPWAIRDLVTGDFISIYQVPKDFPNGTQVKVRTDSNGEAIVTCINCDA